MPEAFTIYEGVYPNLAAAAQYAVGPGFSGETYLRRTLASAKECLQAVEAGGPIPGFHKQRNRMLPILVATQLKKGLRYRILDLGGGLGIGYMMLAEALGPLISDIQYVVVDVPTVCSAGRELFKTPEIEFFDAIPAGAFDLVLSSSAIQYIDEWRQTLNTLSRIGSKYILLADVFAGSIKTFATLQNYYESKIPHWFLNLEGLYEAMDSSGYELRLRNFANVTRLGVQDFVPMDNLPFDRRIGTTLDLLFQRL